MTTYKLKTLTGEQVRSIYQFFEWEALKHADANKYCSKVITYMQH